MTGVNTGTSDAFSATWYVTDVTALALPSFSETALTTVRLPGAPARDIRVPSWYLRRWVLSGSAGSDPSVVKYEMASAVAPVTNATSWLLTSTTDGSDDSF